MSLGLGLGLPLQRGSSFQIASLFTGGRPGWAHDPFNAATLFQDAAMTTRVTAYGQTIGGMLDLSGNGNHWVQSDPLKMPQWLKRPMTALRNFAIGCGDVAASTYWLPTWTQNGVTQTKITSGVDTDGLPYTDYRFTGTATGTFIATIYNNNLSRTPSGTTDTWTASLIARLIAGSATGTSGLQAIVVEETSPSTLVGSTGGNQVTAGTDTIATATRTFTTGNQVRLAVSLAFTNGATIDATFRIKGLQLELAASRSNTQWSMSAYEWYEAGMKTLAAPWYDGVNDGFYTSQVVNWGGATAALQGAGFGKMSDAATANIMETNSAIIANPGFRMVAPTVLNAANAQVSANGGTATVGANMAGYSPPVSMVVTGQHDLVAPRQYGRVNNSTANQNIGVTGTTPFANSLAYLGSRFNGTALPFNGPIFRDFARGGSWTAVELAQVETWLNELQGAY